MHSKNYLRRVTPLTEMDNLGLLDYAYAMLEDCDIPLNSEERTLMLHSMVDSVLAMRKRSQPPTPLGFAPRTNASTPASRDSANATPSCIARRANASPLVDSLTRGLVDSSSAGAEAPSAAAAAGAAPIPHTSSRASRAAVIDIYR